MGPSEGGSSSRRPFISGFRELLALVVRRLPIISSAILKPIVRLGEKHNCAIACITHLTKAGGSNSVHRMIGSIGFAGASRSVWMVAKDSEDPHRRLMLLATCNIAADVGGLAFPIVDGAIAFEAEPVAMSADAALQAEADMTRVDSTQGQAEEWLRMQLADGQEHPVTSIKEAAGGA